MERPCNNCVVQACCTKRCTDYAVFIYKTKDYRRAGKDVANHIDSMSEEKAIEHILIVENACLSLKEIVYDKN